MLILNIVKVRRGLFSRKYITGIHNKRWHTDNLLIHQILI